MSSQYIRYVGAALPLRFSKHMHITLHCFVRSDASYTACKQTSIHACLHSTRRIDAHATRDISFFMIHPRHSLSGLSGQHIHYVHIHIPAFTSFI